MQKLSKTKWSGIKVVDFCPTPVYNKMEYTRFLLKFSHCLERKTQQDIMENNDVMLVENAIQFFSAIKAISRSRQDEKYATIHGAMLKKKSCWMIVKMIFMMFYLSEL